MKQELDGKYEQGNSAYLKYQTYKLPDIFCI